MVSRGYFKVIGTYWDIQSKIKCPGKLLFKHEYADKYHYLDYSKFISYIKMTVAKGSLYKHIGNKENGI